MTRVILSPSTPEEAVINVKPILSSLLVLVCVGCSDEGGTGGESGGTVSSSGGTSNVDSADGGTGGLGEEGGTGGASSGTGSGPAADFVPVVFEEDAACSLDALTRDSATGDLCPKDEVYCNGACLSSAGQTADGCELLARNNTGNSSLNLEDGFLYFNTYTSIYQLDLTTLDIECVMGGLHFPEGMLVADGQIYVGMDDNPGVRGIVRVGTDGDNPMLISRFDRSGSNFQLVDDTLFFSGMSNWDRYYYAVPTAGGTPSDVYTEGGAQGGGYAVLDGYVYVMDVSLLRAPTDDLSSWEEMTSTANGNSLFEVGGTLYWLADQTGELNAREVYSYKPGDADAAELDEIDDAQYLTNNATHLFFTIYGEDIDGAENIYSYPLAGGTAETVATFERSQLVAATATADTLYVSVGSNAVSGGLLRIPLN